VACLFYSGAGLLFHLNCVSICTKGDYRFRTRVAEKQKIHVQYNTFNLTAALVLCPLLTFTAYGNFQFSQTFPYAKSIHIMAIVCILSGLKS
jgi:hypothetical protein